MIEQLMKILSDFSEKNDTDKPVDYAKHELQDLAKEINLEEQQVAELLQQYTIDGKANGSIENDNNTNGWVDEMAVLSLAKWTEFHEEIWPVKLVLVKLRKVAFKVINSSTKLLPAW
ncbi:hypothetical protein L208DRAFT_1380540 [Tricholoma matsutake]|nr:hypothetical protein L208DRAFT_1380540 [Tricholoma matsutake 945]